MSVSDKVSVHGGGPSISVVVPAYNAQEYVAETVRSILSQTHPADEVIVVDDGSTDETLQELARFGGEIRVIRQLNRSAAGAHNTGFGAARGDYVARCDADDLWEPTKLERQVQTLERHPQVDIAFSGAQSFGLSDGPFGPHPGEGLLDRAFGQRLYRENFVCSSSTLIRRGLQRRLGPFVERLPCEDYEYWLRAAKAGAVFFYDPTVLVRYRRREGSVTGDKLAMYHSEYLAHRWHADLGENPTLVREVLAHDLCNIGRALYRQDRRSEARAAFVSSLRQQPTPRGIAWTLALSVPERYGRGLVSAKRALYSVEGA
jgi:glycosyltransferase involved in cell wall biosynthesis